MPSIEDKYVLFNAGIFIDALLTGDSRHAEARPLVEAARRGDMLACTTTGILSEVYAALTWQQAQPPHDPVQAGKAVRLLVEPPSMTRILSDNQEVAIRMLKLAASHNSGQGAYTMPTMLPPRWLPALSRCSPTTPMTGNRLKAMG
jgi:predicted nucleic acid-binding protein